MDIITDAGGNFCSLSELKINDKEKKLLEEISNNLNLSCSIKYLPLFKGLSTAKKIAIKPDGMYPFLVKLDTLDEIMMEYDGYKTLQYNIDSLNILSFVTFKQIEDIGAIVYRYVTKGRVKQLYDRFDTYLTINSNENEIYQMLKITNNIFDIALKKCHWRDGTAEIKPIVLRTFNTMPFEDDFFSEDEVQLLKTIYTTYCDSIKGIKAPFGIIHGDFHPKNVIIGLNDIPVIIDYTHVKKCDCIYNDYAKLETHFLFQIDKELTNMFFYKDSPKSLYDRYYSAEFLILPRSTNNIPSVIIQEIRKILWKNCLSNTICLSNNEIDMGYRAYLIFYFIQLCRRKGVDEDTRRLSYKSVRSLANI